MKSQVAQGKTDMAYRSGPLLLASLFEHPAYEYHRRLEAEVLSAYTSSVEKILSTFERANVFERIVEDRVMKGSDIGEQFFDLK